MRYALLLMLSALVIIGCDDKPELPARLKTPTRPSAENPEPGRPTTQQILSAPRKSVQLARYPLRIEVPDMWKVSSIQASRPVYVLHGPAPHADIVVTLSRIEQADPTNPSVSEPVPFTGAQVQHYVATANQAATQPTDPKTMTLVRKLGGGHIIETRTIRPGQPPVADDTGRLLPALPATMQINLTAYLPGVDHFVGYRLGYDVPVDSYEQDKRFLDSIWESLRHDPTLPSDTEVPPMVPPR